MQLFYYVYLMEYYVYILYSQNLGKYYIGYSSNVDKRIELHLNSAKNKFSHKANDWKLMHTIDCCCKSHALEIEKHVKAMKSKVYIVNLMQYPEMTAKLKIKYNCT